MKNVFPAIANQRENTQRSGMQRTGMDRIGLEWTGSEGTGVEKTGVERNGLVFSCNALLEIANQRESQWFGMDRK